MPRNAYNAVTIDNAVDWDHPLNKGRVAWWLAPPGIAAAGSRMLDLCGKTHGTLTYVTATSKMWTNAKNGLAAISRNSSNYVAAPSTILPVAASAAFTIVISSQLTGGSGSLQNLFGFGHALPGNGSYSTGRYICNDAGPMILWGNTVDVALGITCDFTGLKRRIAVTKTASNAWVSYLNGVRVSSGSVSYGASSGTNINMGSGSGSATTLTGELWDGTIFSRALSASEIAADYSLSDQGYRTPDSPLRWVRGVRYFAPLSAGPAPQTRFFPSMAGMGWC